MPKNINMKNVKDYVKKVNVHIKNYKTISNRTVNKETNKENKDRIYKNKKHIEMCIKIYENIYASMKIYRYIEMHVENYLCENIKSI